MKTADLKAGTEYADCNGRLIVPIEPIANDYLKQEVWTDDGRSFKIEREEKSDPWSNCSTPRGRRRGQAKGVKVAVYDYTKTGKRSEKVMEDVVRPADIKGTWKEYLTLHAATIKSQAEARERHERTKNQTNELWDWLKENSPDHLHFSINQDYTSRGQGFMLTISAQDKRTLPPASIKAIVEALSGAGIRTKKVKR